jgi:hypothetical protein
MSPRFFSKSEAVIFGWNTIKKNYKFFLGLMAVLVLINMFIGLVMASFSEKAPIALVTSTKILFWILNLLISIGIIKITLKFCDQETTSYRDLFSAYRLLGNYILGSIIYGAVVCVGLILLVIPGLYIAIKFQFYSYLIVDKNLGPIEAFKKSAILTKGVIQNLALFWLMLAGINIMGFIALGVGLLATIPVSWLANSYVYRRLQLQAENMKAIPLGGID